MTEKILKLHQQGIRTMEIGKMLGRNQTSVKRVLLRHGLTPILKTYRTSCLVNGCLYKVKTRGYCNTHYAYWRRMGVPTPQSFEERFLSRCEVQKSGCWLWQGSRDGKGYGKVRVNKKDKRAHRIGYELHKSPIPNGLEIDHLCRIKLCVNPKHLEPVTHAENIRRANIKRNQYGVYTK